jgi:hypothetical protein
MSEPVITLPVSQIEGILDEAEEAVKQAARVEADANRRLNGAEPAPQVELVKVAAATRTKVATVVDRLVDRGFVDEGDRGFLRDAIIEGGVDAALDALEKVAGTAIHPSAFRAVDGGDLVDGPETAPAKGEAGDSLSGAWRTAMSNYKRASN